MWTDDWTGIPYAIGGRSRAQGLDCVGLVLALLQARHGVAVPDPAARVHHGHGAALAVAERDWTRLAITDELVREGDVAVFRGLNPGALHLGYLLDGGNMLHTGGAADPSSPRRQPSRVESWRRPVWDMRRLGVYRHPGTAHD